MTRTLSWERISRNLAHVFSCISVGKFFSFRCPTNLIPISQGGGDGKVPYTVPWQIVCKSLIVVDSKERITSAS